MQAAVDGLQTEFFGLSGIAAVKQSICISCKAAVTPSSFRTDLAAKEYTISGLCQCCQDGVFTVVEE